MGYKVAFFIMVINQGLCYSSKLFEYGDMKDMKPKIPRSQQTHMCSKYKELHLLKAISFITVNFSFSQNKSCKIRNKRYIFLHATTV